MNYSLLNFDQQLREFISRAVNPCEKFDFAQLALGLFALQYEFNEPYRRFCNQRRMTPATVSRWDEIPAIPVSAFKQVELTSIPEAERTAWFESSRTTYQEPSRHHHNAHSLELYEQSLLTWFQASLRSYLDPAPAMLFLTPGPEAAPHSSLVYMFEALRQTVGLVVSRFSGLLDEDGAWTVDLPRTVYRLQRASQSEIPIFLLGTAFNFVHLLDYLRDEQLVFRLPPGSMVLETGGYKNRSRSIPKQELHSLITQHVNIPESHIFSEYGMCELSSQAYTHIHLDRETVETVAVAPPSPNTQLKLGVNENGLAGTPALPATTDVDGSEATARSSEMAREDARPTEHLFRFPPWARVQIISPETGRPVSRGETGLIRVFDLANVYSVMAVQTEDLGIEHADGFELIGRTSTAEPRGCSLMSATT